MAAHLFRNKSTMVADFDPVTDMNIILGIVQCCDTG